MSYTVKFNNLLSIERSLKLEDILKDNAYYDVNINRKNYEEYTNNAVLQGGSLYSKLSKFQSLTYVSDIRDSKPQHVKKLLFSLKDNAIRELNFKILNSLNFNEIKLDILDLVTVNATVVQVDDESYNSYFEFFLNQLEKNDNFAGLKNLRFFRHYPLRDGNQEGDSVETVTRRKLYLVRLTLYGKLSIKNTDFIGLEYLHIVGGEPELKFCNCKLRDLKTLVYTGEYRCGTHPYKLIHNFIVECNCEELEMIYMGKITVNYFEAQQRSNIIKKIRIICKNLVTIVDF